MLNINSIVPDFEVDAFYEGEIKKIKLSNYKGKWVILIFYPADFTFVCPTELEEAQIHYEKIKELGGEVMSVSTDSVYSHKSWHEQSPVISKITFPMLSDQGGRVSKSFGIYVENEGVALRGTFLIDPECILKTIEVHDNSIGRSMKETLRKLESAKFIEEHPDTVCPASWEPGKDALKIN